MNASDFELLQKCHHFLSHASDTEIFDGMSGFSPEDKTVFGDLTYAGNLAVYMLYKALSVYAPIHIWDGGCNFSWKNLHDADDLDRPVNGYILKCNSPEFTFAEAFREELSYFLKDVEEAVLAPFRTILEFQKTAI